MKKIYILLSSILFALVIISTQIASAHVVVKPSQVDLGAFLTFTMGVPVEKDMPTIGLRLVLPPGLLYVTPNVKPGWKISVKKDGDAVTEISWTGASIPAGQRDEFLFSAKTPIEASSLSWKAYQTYQDGSIVAWDKDPATIKNTGGEPFSITKVSTVSTTTSSTEPSHSSSNSLAFILSVVALAFSLIAFTQSQKNKKMIIQK